MRHTSSPTVRRRELAARLRELRVAAGFTIDEVATQLLVSSTKLSRLETATRPASLRDVKDLCEIYGVSAGERDRLMVIARDSRRRSWWQQYDLPYSTYVGLEADAVMILHYTTSIVPGLLQTEAYARAVTDGILFNESREAVDKIITARMTRQHLLTGDQPPGLWAVIDEAVLHRVVGGPKVMELQLQILLEQAVRPDITLQVIPFTSGSHAGMDSSFTILNLEEGIPSFVYVEGLLGHHYLESPTDLKRFSRVFDHLRASALSPRDSTVLVSRMAERYASSD